MKKHVWVGVDDQHVHLGLTNYIQGELDRVISVELPEVGDKIEKGEVVCGSRIGIDRSRVDRAGFRHSVVGESEFGRASLGDQRRSLITKVGSSKCG